MKTTTAITIMLVTFTSCLSEDELKRPFSSYLPTQLSDGWILSTPDQENIDATGLTQVYLDFHSDPTWQVRSLLVLRNGRLLAESYTKDHADQVTPRAIWSATKQVMGILTGIALEQQIIADVNDPISDYLPETQLYPDKESITIEHLLTMRSGISYSNDGLGGQTDDILRQLPDQITAFILGRPLASSPGTVTQYKDCDPQLLSSTIQEAAGRPTAQWAREVLFDKMEVTNLEWDHYKDGVTLGGFGILTTPRELAKFGQCVLDSGQWKGITVVSKAWIKEMATVRNDDVYGNQFCYLWWRDRTREMLFMSGHGGQYVCILPSKKLVVVMTAEVNTQGEFQFGRDKAFEWVDRIVSISN